MASTATARTKGKAVSSSTKTTKNDVRSNNTKTNTTTRSNVSVKPGKSGRAAVQTVSKPTVGRREDLPAATIKEMKGMRALGVSMTNIHRIFMSRIKGLKYYDVWKALSV